MHPWPRPEPHSSFANESADLLLALRADIQKNKGRALGEFFENRSLWTYGWKRAGLHRRTLVGPAWRYLKCAWCEQYRERKRETDVEHFRPKVCATEWTGTPPLVSDTPPTEVNPRGGYWWLAFSWSNFTISCKTCNQHWKRNLFPVRKARTADVCEGDEKDDSPLLLDPAGKYLVTDHFRWTPGGILEGVSEQGHATIVTCGLNRSELLHRRAQAAENLLGLLGSLVRAVRGHRDAERREVWKKLVALCSPTAEFTAMARWWVEKRLGRPWDALPDLS